MNESRRPELWLRKAFIAVALALPQACVHAQAIPQGEEVTWDSPKMQQIENEWQTLRDAYSSTSAKIPGRPGKDKYGRLQGLRYRLLGKRFSDPDLRQLAVAAGPIPDRDFTNHVFTFMVTAFIEAGDRNSLVTLLSKRCPPRIGNQIEIEFWLAAWGYRLKDPILILSEAYSKCESPETRHILAAAMRRAFGGHGIIGKEDADYINNATQWYEKEKDHLTVNIRYLTNDAGRSLERYEKDPELYEGFPLPAKRELLFEKTPSFRALPGNDQGPEQTRPEPAGRGAEKVSPTTAEKELAKLAGTWKVIGGTYNGEPTNRDKFKDERILFGKEMMQRTWILTDGEKVEEKYRLRLDVQQRPLAIDLIKPSAEALKKEQTTALIYELQDEPILGIFELNGDTLRICLAATDGRYRPTAFETEKGSRKSLFVLKRAKE